MSDRDKEAGADEHVEPAGFCAMPRLRQLLLVFLLAYVTLLVLGAWPDVVRPHVLDEVSRAAKRVLFRITINPGLDVFLGDKEKSASLHRALCVAVVARGPEGKARVLYSDLGTCEHPSVRIVDDRYALLFRRVFMEAARLPIDERDAMLAAAASFFCHAERFAPPPDVLSLIAVQQMTSRETGQLSSRAFLHMHYGCAQDRPMPEPWPPLSDVLPR